MKRNITPEEEMFFKDKKHKNIWLDELNNIKEAFKKLYRELDTIPEGDKREEKYYQRIKELRKRREYLLVHHNDFEICKECGSIIYPYEFKELHVHRHKDLCVNCSRKYK